MAKPNYIVCGASRGSDLANSINSLIDESVLEIGYLKQLPTAALESDVWAVIARTQGVVGKGGIYAYSGSVSKALHDGVNVIAPEALVAWNGEEADEAQLMSWTGAGTGAYVALAVSPEIAAGLVEAAKNEAIASAVATAANDATAKANAAKAEAISTASADATTKANAARAEAISTASADATTKASGSLATARSELVKQISNLKALPTTGLVNGSQYSVAGKGIYTYKQNVPSWQHDGIRYIYPPHLDAWDGSESTWDAFAAAQTKNSTGCYKINSVISTLQPTYWLTPERMNVYTLDRIGVRLSDNSFSYIPAKVYCSDNSDSIVIDIEFSTIENIVGVFGLPGINLAADADRIIATTGTNSVSTFSFLNIKNSVLVQTDGSPYAGPGEPYNIKAVLRKRVKV